MIISRKDAKAQGLKRYFTGKPCKRGHVAERYVGSRACLECQNEHRLKHYYANREAGLEYRREYRENNREKISEYHREWREANRDKVNATNAKRRAAKLQRTPAWADKELIALFYAEAQALTELTGIPHEVDHIVPLQGEAVSGLHVATNLQVITQEANRSKGNAWG